MVPDSTIEEVILLGFIGTVARYLPALGRSGVCKGCLERTHGLAVERHGEIIQVHGEACAALEGRIS